MFEINTRKLPVSLLTVIVMLGLSEARAGLFDWKPFQRKPPATQTKLTASRSNRVIQAGGFEPIAESAGPSPTTALYEDVPTAGYDASDRPDPAMKMPCEKTFRCFNCGEEDRCQTGERRCRKKCNQTWYPRVAPYCQSGWGYTQPTWRRTEDTNSWQPPQPAATPWHAPPVGPVPALEPGDSETLPEAPAPPEVPAVPRETSSRR